MKPADKLYVCFACGRQAERSGDICRQRIHAHIPAHRDVFCTGCTAEWHVTVFNEFYERQAEEHLSEKLAIHDHGACGHTGETDCYGQCAYWQTEPDVVTPDVVTFEKAVSAWPGSGPASYWVLVNGIKTATLEQTASGWGVFYHYNGRSAMLSSGYGAYSAMREWAAQNPTKVKLRSRVAHQVFAHG